MTIKQQAEALLAKYGWTYDDSRRSPGWTHPKTPNAVYLGSRGSIRHGKNRTDSTPVTYRTGEEIVALEILLLRTEKLATPEPVEPVVNPTTELRRKCHAIVQAMSQQELEWMITNSPEARERRRQQLRDKPRLRTTKQMVEVMGAEWVRDNPRPTEPKLTDAQIRQAYWDNEQTHYGLDGSDQLDADR